MGRIFSVIAGFLMLYGVLNAEDVVTQPDRAMLIQRLQQNVSTEVDLLVGEVPNLSASQEQELVQASVKLLLNQRAYRGKMIKVREERLGRDEMKKVRNEMMETRKADLSRVESILNTSQFRAYRVALSSLVQESRSERGAGSGGGQGGGGRGGNGNGGGMGGGFH